MFPRIKQNLIDSVDLMEQPFGPAPELNIVVTYAQVEVHTLKLVCLEY